MGVAVFVRNELVQQEIGVLLVYRETSLVSQTIRGILYFILYINHFTDRRHFPLFFFSLNS